MSDGTRGGSSDASLDLIATDQLTSGGFSGQKAQAVKLIIGADAAGELVSNANPLPVSDAGGSLTVDGVFFQATQPVSGTVTATVGTVTAVTSITNVVHVDDNAGSLTVDGTVTANAGTGTMAVSIVTAPVLVAGSAIIGKVGIDQTTPGTTNLVALAANQSVNQAQVAGTAVDTNSGVKSAGTQRFVIATDQPQLTNALKVDGTATTQPVSGTVTANAGTGTLAVSLATVPSHAVTNAGTFATQAAQSGTWNVTNVSGTVSLPTGAATSAKQPALGTAGTASTDVITVQGIASGTAQPVSGTVTANAGTNLNTSALALDASVGSLTETAPATDTASSGLNGRLQRIAQNLSTIAAQAGPTEYAEDTAHVSGDFGRLALGVRKDTATALAGTDGDYMPAIFDASGRMHVNASGVAVPITDNAGSLTVDNGGTFAVQAAQSGTWSVRTQDGAGNALTSKSLGTERALSVGIVDASGNQITSFGGGAGGSQYVEDVASAGAENLTLAGAVRRDTAASSSGTDGDYSTINTDATGRLWVHAGLVDTLSTITNVVHVDDNSGSLTVDGTVAISGTVTVDTELNAAAALADAASASVSTASIGAVGLVMNATTLDRQRAVIAAMDSTGTGIAAAGMVGQLDDTATTTVTENQFAPVRISSRRALLVEGDGPTSATTAGTQVASSATSVSLLASNALRRGFRLYNGSTQLAYVKFGATASTTSFSVYMAPGADYEMFGVNIYSGAVDGIWAAANGNMQVTEW